MHHAAASRGLQGSQRVKAKEPFSGRTTAGCICSSPFPPGSTSQRVRQRSPARDHAHSVGWPTVASLLLLHRHRAIGVKVGLTVFGVIFLATILFPLI
jgi:hypothetical protein